MNKLLVLVLFLITLFSLGTAAKGAKEPTLKQKVKASIARTAGKVKRVMEEDDDDDDEDDDEECSSSSSSSSDECDDDEDDDDDKGTKSRNLGRKSAPAKSKRKGK